MTSVGGAPDGEQTLISPPGYIAVIIGSDKLTHQPIGERLEHLKISGGELFGAGILHNLTHPYQLGHRALL